MSAQTLLLMDTAMPRGVVALLQNGKVGAERFLHESRSHGEKIADAIETNLNEAQVNYTDLQGIVVGVGPGSFVGIRVALATAKGIALARNIPLWGVSTLSALAASHELHSAEKTLALVDARRGQGYVQSFQNCEGNWAACNSAQACDPHEIDELAACHDVVVGNGLFLLAQPPANGVELPGVEAIGLFQAFQLRCVMDQPEDECLHLVPAYVRAPDAKKPAVPANYSLIPSPNK